MTTVKFDNIDREQVVKELEKYFGIKLKKVGSKDKLLIDSSGKPYIVIGGTSDWHGIQKEMFREVEMCTIEGVLVIAKRKLHSIDIFAGSLNRLINSKELLYETDNAFQFKSKTVGDVTIIEKIYDVSLKKISTINYSLDDNASDKTSHKALTGIKRLFNHLTFDEKEELLKKLN